MTTSPCTSAVCTSGPRSRPGAAAIGALAMTALAPPDATRMALIGTGTQAWHQLWALHDIQEPWKTSRCTPPTRSTAPGFCASRDELGLPARAVDSARAAVTDGPMVVLARHSPEPVIDASWLAPGAYLATVGPKQVGHHEFRTRRVAAHSLYRGHRLPAPGRGLLPAESPHDDRRTAVPPRTRRTSCGAASRSWRARTDPATSPCSSPSDSAVARSTSSRESSAPSTAATRRPTDEPAAGPTDSPPTGAFTRSAAWSPAPRVFFAAIRPRGGRLGGRRLLLGRLAGRLLRRLARQRRTLGALLGEQLEAALGGDLLRVVVAAQGRVRLPIGDIGAEAALLDDDRALRDRVCAQLGERRQRPPARAAWAGRRSPTPPRG